MNRLVAVVAFGAIVVGCASPASTATLSPSSAPPLAPPSSSPNPQPSSSPSPTPPSASPSPASSPSAEEAVARAYIAAINAADAEAAAALVAAGAKARTSASASYQTLADAAAVLAFVKASPPCLLQITGISQTGSVVVIDADIGAASTTACPVEPGTGIQIPLTILDGLITMIG